MNNLLEGVQVLAQYSTPPSILGLVVYLLYVNGHIPFLKKENRENLGKKMEYLKVHYNDELTATLRDIRDSIDENTKALEEFSILSRENFIKIDLKFAEYDKYGFPARDRKK